MWQDHLGHSTATWDIYYCHLYSPLSSNSPGNIRPNLTPALDFSTHLGLLVTRNNFYNQRKQNKQRNASERWFSSHTGHSIPNTGPSVMFLLQRGTNPTQSSCIYAQVCFKTRTHMPNNVIAKYKVIWFFWFLNILMQMWNKLSTLSPTLLT